MNTRTAPALSPSVAASMEEVAQWLSIQEGRTVTVEECRMIECQALRKLRRTLVERGLGYDDLAPAKR